MNFPYYDKSKAVGTGCIQKVKLWGDLIMSIRSGAEYIKALESRQPEVWLRGERVTDLVNHPVFKQPIQEIARLYDMQHDPEYQDKITHICAETGKRVNNGFLF